jgi:hypothetical protein
MPHSIDNIVRIFTGSSLCFHHTIIIANDPQSVNQKKDPTIQSTIDPDLTGQPKSAIIMRSNRGGWTWSAPAIPVLYSSHKHQITWLTLGLYYLRARGRSRNS